ncbi:MAG: DUF2116 family Zn-ribbon domain-containing protein [Nitrososphaerota archaeon]|nr:DUF2116 family Zn-ribbon domain-containing protein [Nitrososphaerota archaeon]
MSAKKEKKIRIVDHRHCRICGRTILPDQEFCSEKCRNISESMINREKRMRKMLFVIYVVMIIVLVALLMLRPMAH